VDRATEFDLGDPRVKLNVFSVSYAVVDANRAIPMFRVSYL